MVCPDLVPFGAGKSGEDRRAINSISSRQAGLIETSDQMAQVGAEVLGVSRTGWPDCSRDSGSPRREPDAFPRLAR